MLYEPKIRVSLYLKIVYPILSGIGGRITMAILYSILVAVISFGFFQNCSQIQFSAMEKGNNGGLCIESDGEGCGEVHETLKTLQPALAVRGMSCLMCHADVRSNIITDFGYGRPYYLGGENINLFDRDQNWYNNLANSWQTAKSIVGTVYVPDKPITAKAQAVLGPNYAGQPLLSLPEFFVTKYDVNWNYFKQPEVSHSSMSLRVQPLSGPPVKGLSQVMIRAPSEAEIQSLAPSLFAGQGSGFQRLGDTSPVQFISKMNGSQSFVINDENSILECSNADIVVKGTLYLRGLRVNAQRGCRLYVSGSVFIEDSITYVGPSDKQNIQITSANAIIMGISKTRLKRRLIDDHRGLQIDGTRPYMERANQAMNEAEIIGSLKDSQDDYGGVRKSVDFTSILLNAPIIHSRYLGRLKGTIIGDAALFALGEFHFEFDSIFGEVAVLPLLPPVLVAK